MKFPVKVIIGLILSMLIIEILGSIFLGGRGLSVILVIIFGFIFFIIKNWQRYWVKGGMIGLLIPIIVMLFFWQSAASTVLPTLQAKYDASVSCKKCEKEGGSGIDCAVKVCNSRWGEASCEESIERNTFNTIERSNIFKDDRIKEIRRKEELDFIYNQCSYKIRYEKQGLVDSREAVYHRQPTIITSFFSKETKSRALDGLGVVFLIGLPVLVLPIFIGVIIGILIKKKIT